MNALGDTMYYRQLRAGLNDSKYKLIPSGDVKNWLVNPDKDYYTSIYEYTEEQKELFIRNDSVAGIRDVTTSKLVWDFDSSDPDLARQDALTLVYSLNKDHGISGSAICISMSGNKGYHIELETDQRFTVDEFKTITSKLASYLPTYDKVVNDPNRVFRVLGTKHQTSGLYKFPLKGSQLESLTTEEIKLLAVDLNNALVNSWGIAILPQSILNLKTVVKEIKVVTPADSDEITYKSFNIDFLNKVKGFSNCKWAMTFGYGIKSGERKTKLVSLAATCKALNFTEGNTYYVIKHSMKEGSRLYNVPEMEKEELKDIMNQVFSPMWKGGTYSCKDGKTQWLNDLCKTLGTHQCSHNNEKTTIESGEVFDLFKNYAENFEKNVLYTGISSLDERIKLMVGTSNAIAAPPGVGKTSLSLQILNNTSLSDIPSIFFSFDMFHSALYLRMLQKHTGCSQDEIYYAFKHNNKKMQEWNEILKHEYKNVRFCFKSGQTLQEIDDTILETEDRIGKKIKLAIFDYNELIQSDYSDATAASAQVAQRIRQISNDRSICGLTLLQPSKNYSTPADDMTNFNAAKGSSAIVQSLTLMLGCSRPGFNPKLAGTEHDTDRYFNITCLKNRNGPLFSLDYSWDGLAGSISELSSEHFADLRALREKRELDKKFDKGVM